jgi:hypothetical protein
MLLRRRLRPLTDRLTPWREDIVDESSNKLVKNVWRLPERRLLQSQQAMASSFPQIRIFWNLEIIEDYERIIGTNHDSQRNGTIFDEPALICPDAQTRGLEDRLTCEPVRTLDRVSKRDRYPRAEYCFTESIDFRWTKILFSGQTQVQRWDKALVDVVPAYGRSPTDEQSLDAAICDAISSAM